MRKGLFILLAGLLIFGLLPSAYAGVAPEAATFSRGGEQLGSDNPGPVRDPGRDLGDWIFYDDGNGRLLNIANNYWTRVSYTPNADYRLEQIMFQYDNGRNVQGPNIQLRVYADNPNNDQLGALLYQADIGLPDDGDWVIHDIDLPEDEMPVFAANEDFSIVFGIAPGGNPNNNEQGWWNSLDAGTVTRRTRLAIDANGNPGNQWYVIDADALVRANGTYLIDFFDMGIVDVYNTEGEENEGKWIFDAGTEHVISVDVSNLGQDVAEEEYIINFTILDPDGNEVFNYDMLAPAIEGGDTVAVECDSIWHVPADVVGKYSVWATVTVIAAEDSNNENDQGALDQIVWDPDLDSDVWLGYVDADEDRYVPTNMIGDEQDGFGVLYRYPGHPEGMGIKPTSVRYAIAQDDNATQPQVRIGILNWERNQYAWIWADTGACDAGEGWQWVEYEVPDSIGTFFEGEALIVMYFYVTDNRIMMDQEKPQAGGSVNMPWVMTQTNDDGDQISIVRSGDYAIQAKLVWDDAPPEGKYCSINPRDTLFFGYDLNQDQAYTADIEFFNRGTEVCRVSRILISRGDQEYLSGEVINAEGDITAGFDIPPQAEEPVIVRMTYTTPPEEHILETSVLVISNSDNPDQTRITLQVRGSTVTSVRDHTQPGIPGEYSMSQNYPNPFNPTTTVDFSIVKAGEVTFSIFDMNGRLVDQVFQGSMEAGYHSVEIDATNLPAGIYMYRLTAGEFSQTAKMILLK